MNRSLRALIALLLPLLIVSAFLVLAQIGRKSEPGEAEEGTAPLATARASGKPAELLRAGRKDLSPADREALAEFRRWTAEFGAVQPGERDRARRLEEGVALARDRRLRMARLIRDNPEQAIAESLSFAEWTTLPEEVQALVEKPFSVTADYHVYPICAAPGTVRPADAPDYLADLEMPDGAQLDAFVYGRRSDWTSKRNLAVQGIALDGLAALRDGVFQKIGGPSLDVARDLFPAGQTDGSRSFATGEAVGPEAVTAVAGGRLYVFASEEERQRFDARFAKLEALPGPLAASAVLGRPLAVGEAGGFDWDAVEAYAMEQASTWTETKKDLFLIRVNFSDNLAEPVARADAESVMNGSASDMIRSMSYGKTWLETAASANLYTLPQTAEYYVNGGSNGLNSELLRDARNTFRNTKSGADAGIDIGPVSENTNGDGGGLGGYQIVGVTFSSIGMTGGTVLYAGLASVGGSNLWMQGNNSADVYAHEWGHNYGLSHASSWDTTDGSVAGDGVSTEYGDIFDLMGGGPVPEGHFHPQGKAKLNWLTSAEWIDATASGSGTYRIFRIDDASTTEVPRGVRVTKDATLGSEEYYWVGYRPAFGGNDHLQRGAYLNWQRPGQTRCWLLDTTPGTAGGKEDAAVDLGRTYADELANVFITPLASGGTGAERYLDVQVNLGPFPGNNAPASGGISGASTVPARANASYSVSASDVDSDPLAYSWNTQDGAVSENAPSLLHAWTTGGTYALTATVSDMRGGAVTVNKTVAVTDPIDSWTLNGVGSTENLQEVIYGKGRFVAAEYWGTVYASWDGSTWSNAGDPPAFDKDPQLAFGNGVFVLAGKKESVAGGQICFSSDGRIWSAASFPAGMPQVRDVQFGGGGFLAVGDDGTVLASADGMGWTLTTVPGEPDFRLLTWDGSTWIAVAYNAAHSRAETIWTSLDGVTWAEHGDLGVSTDQVEGANGTVFALGWYAGVMYSTDHGLTWKDAQLPGTTRWSTFCLAIAEDGTLFVTGRAMDESGTPDALLVSSDGQRWSRTTENGGNIAVAAANGIVFGAGKFLTVEDGGVTRSSGSFYVPNATPAPSFTLNPATGVARQAVSLEASATDGDGDELVYAWDFGPQYPILDGPSVALTFPFGGSYTATLRVSDGRGGLSTLTHNITITDPARTFTQRTSGTTKNLNAIAANDSVAVAVGGSYGVVLQSTDGVTWTARNAIAPEWDGNITFHSVVWDGSKFLAAGQDHNGANWVGVIYSSTDGATWTRRYVGAANTQLHGLACENGGAVAVGNSGTVLTSADGLSWNPVVIPGIAPNLRGAAWNGSVYAVAGYTGSNGGSTVFTSADRVNWMNQSAGTGLSSWQDLRKIAWLNDRFVASGWYSKVRTSVDGAETFATTRSVSEENPAMGYGDGIYFTAGVEDAANAAKDVDVLSLDGDTWYSFAAPTADNRNGAVFFKHTFITVGNGGSIWQSADTTPASGFAAWQSTQFPGGGAAAVAGGDPDHDGIVNLIEYALGLNPESGSGSDGATGAGQAAQGAGRTWLHLDMPEPAMPDVTYVIQGTTELGGVWSDLAEKTGAGAWVWLAGGDPHIEQGVPAGGRMPVEVGAPDSANGQPRYFLRLQVALP